MSRLTRLAAAALLLALAAPAGAQLSNLVVTVANSGGGRIAGANVAALSFQSGQPIASVSALGVTDSSGIVRFNGVGGIGSASPLTAGYAYIVVASSQSFLPSAIGQFSSNPPSLTAAAPSASPAAVTIALSPAANLGEIDASVSGATPNSIIFGQLGLQAGGGAAAVGFLRTDGAGGGVLSFFDVAFASAGTYNASAFDPTSNRAAEAAVNSNLNSLTTPILSPPLGFANAPPPASQINQAQQNTSGVSVLGVVMDTTAAHTPVAYTGVTLNGSIVDQFGQTRQDNRYFNTDQNGVFQAYGLTLGVTYYTTVFPSCNPGTNVCYQGLTSTAAQAGLGAAPGQYDFLYTSTVPFQLNLPDSIASGGSGSMAVYVTDQFGNPPPQLNVSVWGDNSNWRTGGGPTCGGGGFTNTAGLASVHQNAATNYVLITGLPSGNYEVSAFTPYGQTVYNAGPGSTSTFGNSQCTPGSPSLRVTIDTATSADVYVYDVFGNLVQNGSSITIPVTISTSGTGSFQTTVSFPSAVDLSSRPVSITLSHNCFNCGPSGGYLLLNSSSQAQTSSYSLAVASGVAYQFNVQADYWAPIFPGGSSNSNNVSVDLTQSTYTSVNIQFVPGGRVVGRLHKPDGSIYVPSQNQFVSVGLNGNGGGAAGGQVGQDGSFTLSAVAPGNYTMDVFAGSNGGSSANSFPYTISQPPPTVAVTANTDTQADVYLANAVTIRPVVAISSLPVLNIISSCSNSNNGDCPPENYGVFAFPQGTQFNSTLVSSLVNNNGGSGVFPFSVSVGTSSACGNGTSLSVPGFCTGPLTVAGSGTLGSTYDFYVMRVGSFDQQNFANDARPYFTIETATRNVVVSPQSATSFVVLQQGGSPPSTSTVQDIILTPPVNLHPMPQAVLTGTVTITNLITQRQFQQLGGNFNNFLQYLPIAWVYDSSGTLRAFGVTVPPPVGLTPALNDVLKQSVASGNFAQFNSLFRSSSWGLPGYDIRGLTAGQTYGLVFTTPNYPPFKTTVTLGAAGSTTTLNVNFDSNPGSNLNGVVLSTDSKVISGAQVTVQGAGYAATSLTTDSSGSWQLNGLGAGQYQILATASGFAQQAQNVDVSGSGPVLVPSFVLTRSNASISGTVYTNNPICPAGVICSAFGKTVLQGVTVLAYDDTLNVLKPASVLPLYRGVTNSSGAYEIDGLQTGDIYKVFAESPGYYVLNQTTLTVSGSVAGFDFALQPKPLDVNIFGHPVAPNYQFQVTNFQQFSGGKAWVGQSPFVKTTSTDVSSSFTQQPDSQGNPQMLLSYPLTSLTAGTVYVLHVEAQPNNPSAPIVTKEVNFGVNLPNNTCQNIDQALVGDSSGLNAQGQPLNQVPLDITGGTSGNASGMSLPAGGVIPLLSTSVPSMCMSNTDASVSPQAAVLKSTGAFASGVYQVTLSSVNYTAKGFNLTFAYNQAGAALNDLAIYSFNSALNEWQSVPGLQTLNPVNGTISVNGLKSLASVLSAGGTGVASFSPVSGASARTSPSRLMALTDGRSYRPNAVPILPDDTGLFAVMHPSQLSVGSFSGGTLVVYNFPNPFNLQSKTVNVNSTASNACTGLTSPTVTTNGTIIKFEVPSGMSGHGVIRVYTLSGRLVRDLDQGDVTGGTCTYTSWDGLNRNGLPVANGVYYGILTVGGSKASSGTFKMAVIK
ncbi:MAG TPA: carboxypeptidase regulatory-like domain-containing protein [Elusimicrobiota bacterium]|nr:carboxypeptidase regulatory-like domain-containing protein [Elusimicrobiota bacterium]